MNTEELELTKKAVELLNDRNLKDLKELLAEQNPADISNIFEEVPRTDVILLFRLLPKELAADTFAHLDSDEQELIIKGFSDKEIEAIMEDLFIDDAVDLIEEMPASVVKRILKNTDRETRNTINDILKYPKDCAGSIMTTEYVNFRPQQTVEEAFSIIRKTGVDKETIYTCYVIEKDRKLSPGKTSMTCFAWSSRTPGSSRAPSGKTLSTPSKASAMQRFRLPVKPWDWTTSSGSCLRAMTPLSTTAPTSPPVRSSW